MERPTATVIPLFGPDTAERIVVGAHYDSIDVPAADYNASVDIAYPELR